MPKAAKWGLLGLSGILILILASTGVAVLPSRPDLFSSKAKAMTNEVLELKLGEYGKDLIARTPLKVLQSSVAGLTFFEVSDITTGVEPTVRLLHGGRVLEFPQARSVMMDEDSQQGWPIGDISIEIKMPAPPEDAGQLEAMKEYDAAVFRLYNDIVDSIARAGWRRYIPLSEPRIAGIETYRFNPDYRVSRYDGYGHADPTYALTFDDWRNLDAVRLGGWSWYLPDANIDLIYSRSPREPGYRVHDKFEIKIINDRTALIFYDPKNNSDLDAGVAAYKSSVSTELVARREAEQKAISAGIPILSDYTDPPIGGIEIPKAD